MFAVSRFNRVIQFIGLTVGSYCHGRSLRKKKQPKNVDVVWRVVIFSCDLRPGQDAVGEEAVPVIIRLLVSLSEY